MQFHPVFVAQPGWVGNILSISVHKGLSVCITIFPWVSQVSGADWL